MIHASLKSRRFQGGKTAAGCLVGGLLLLLCFTPQAAGDARPLFAEEATLSVTLAAPWREFERDGDSDERYPTYLEYQDRNGQTHRLALTVERRGRTRRALCRFPPLRLRFDRSTTPGTVFEGQRSLKMVTHCSRSRRWEQYYVLEMLAYRIYNLVTERSLRVRALDITYVDEQHGSDDAGRFAFLLEHVRDVARRNDLSRVRTGRVGPEHYDPEEITRFMLFQYLIGNTDWSVWTATADERCCHNVRTIGVLESESLFALPYDFDAAGWVDASYAAPHESLPIQRVRERLYRGFCRHNPALESVRREFLELEEEIRELVRAEPLLTSRNRNRALRYLSEFFQTLKDPDRFESEVTTACRG